MGRFEDEIANAIRDAVRSVAEERRAGDCMAEAQERGDISYALRVSARVALRKGLDALALGDRQGVHRRQWGDGFGGEGEKE